MDDNEIESLNNLYGRWGPVRDDDNESGDEDQHNDDEEAYDYSFYDSADMTPRTVSQNNAENYDEEDRVASDNEAHQTDNGEETDKESNEDEEDDHDNRATHYTDASEQKRQTLGLSPNGKPFCFLCAEEHLAPQCTTYPEERVRSRQCSCGLYHTEGVCTVWSSDSDY